MSDVVRLPLCSERLLLSDDVVSDGLSQSSVPEPKPLGVESFTPPLCINPKPTRRRTDNRVRPGEGWKQRRLPKACW